MHFPLAIRRIASLVNTVTNIFSYFSWSKTHEVAQDRIGRGISEPQNKKAREVNSSVTVGTTVALTLFLGYFRPDRAFVSVASHLYDPSFYAGGALVFYTVTASYARGQGRKDAVKLPSKLAYQLATSLLSKSNQQLRILHEKGSPDDWAQDTSLSILENGALVLQKGKTTLRGAIVLLCEQGGSPEALLESLGAAELTLVASDLGYLIPPDVAGVVIATSIAAATAFTLSSYGEESTAAGPSRKRTSAMISYESGPSNSFEAVETEMKQTESEKKKES